MKRDNRERGAIVLSVQESDLAAIEFLKDFIPQKVFDAHVHLHVAATMPTQYNPKGVFYRKKGTFEDYLVDMSPFLPGAQTVRLNAMPMPDVAMNERSLHLREQANGHIFQQVAAHSGCVGSPYIMNGDSGEDILKLAQTPGVKALKCYCFSAGVSDHEHCTIDEYLPEAAWDIADQLGLGIVLHMMRPGALSDEDNFSYITKMTRRYANAQLILAHCARGFASWTVVDKIRALEDCGNIWFDMAAVCESAPIAACVLKNAGKRTVWGSDYPICMNRGKVVSMGTNFAWFIGKTVPEYANPCFVAIENLLAFRQAAVMLQLDQTQIEDLFYRNALHLFGVTDQT